ncbi:MAG TPA: Gfo/Idh/MocA family oxidoreductase [Planctomycetota bacterium]|nr:Gfo/Idh/MocA family oxidoreductase [Planctomycetota bacterium]HRR78955.1 Gfo/Idh/MocA family oxidoreductase [Planctomycetota bacterium]HRT96819.1 Gfo/Idh/MocA family oxidoreductase [Planctomycetota bacterium]
MKHLRWGLLAAGGIARRFAKGLATIPEQATALAVGSRDLAKAQKFAEEHKIPRAYGSYEELLADKDVDAVYISTPNSLHAEWSIKAAKAGKHILCEKPVTVNAAELRKVLGVVKRCGVFFMEAFMYRCHPQWKKLLEIIKAGTIGEVRILQSAFAFNMGLQLQNIRLSNPLAGGGLMDVGCYCVSFCRLVAGEEPKTCRAVAHIGKQSRVDEYAAGVLQFPSGIVATFACGTQCGTPSMANVYGSKGSIVVTNPWFPSDENAKLIVSAEGKTETIEVQYGRDLYANEALTVAENLRRRQARPTAMTWDDSLGQMKTLDALRASMGLRFDCE